MFCLSFISSLAKAKLSFPCVGAPIIFIGHISEVPCFNIISSAIRQQASTMDWCIAAFLLFSPMLFWRCLHCVRCHSTTAQEDWTRRIQIRCSLGGNVTMFRPVRDMAVIKIYWFLNFFWWPLPLLQWLSDWSCIEKDSGGEDEEAVPYTCTKSKLRDVQKFNGFTLRSL